MSSRTGKVVALLALVVALPIASAAAAKKPATVESSRHLWATVNYCDTDPPLDGIAPNSVGVRASMPGSRDGREVMWMRFRLQFFKDADMRWHNVTLGVGDTGWRRVGLARYKARQAGNYFIGVAVPQGAPSLRVRAKVNFEWRLHGKVVRHAVKLTEKGHKSSAGSFPDGYSEAECTVTA